MTATEPQSDQPVIRAETPFDAAKVERVVATAFGVGRFAKTAERLREGSRPVAGWVVSRGAEVVGSVRLWPITIGGESALFLGPIAVDSRARKAGLGAHLVEACLDHADERGLPVLLVGDAPFFGRFGFVRVQGVIMPGPVDPARLLGRELTLSGPVRIA